MNKIQSVKNHFRNNKVTYVACGVTAVVVAGTTYYFTRNARITKQTLELIGETVVNNAPKQSLCYKPTMKNIIEFVETSTPSKQVALLDAEGNLKSVFRSIGEAARVTGLDKGQISKVVNGIADSVGGEKFISLAPLLQEA